MSDRYHLDIKRPKIVSFVFSSQILCIVCFIIDNKFNLEVFDIKTKNSRGTMKDVASAISNESGDFILVAQFLIKDHILVLDPDSLIVKNKITLSFKEWVKFDVYRPFNFSEYENGLLFFYVSLFSSQEKIDDNCTDTLLFFCIGEDINDKTTLDQLKSDMKIQYYHETTYVHCSDDDPPVFKLQMQNNPN